MAAPDIAPARVESGLLGEHYLPNYAGRIYKEYQRNGGPLELPQAIRLFNELMDDGPVDKKTVTVAATDALGSDGLYRPATGTDQDGNTRRRTNNTPGVIAVAATRTMQISFKFNAERQGFSENFHYQSTDSDPYKIGENVAIEYAKARRECLKDSVKLEAVEISDVAIKGDSYLNVMPNLGFGFGLGTDGSASLNQAAMFRAQSADKLTRANYYFRGFERSTLPIWTVGMPFLNSSTDKLNKWETFLQRLLQPGSVGSVSVEPKAKFVIKSFNADADAVGWSYLADWGLDSKGYLTAEVTEPDSLAPNVGDRIKVSVPRKKCVRGVSGDMTIIKVASAAGVVRVTLDKRPSCGVASLDGVLGEAMKYQLQWKLIDTVRLTRITHRKTGRAFFVPRGRQSARPC